MKKLNEKIESSIKKVEKWVVNNNYRGFDPFDGLSSPLVPLTFGNLLLERILMQTIRQSPINLRPFLGVKPLDSNIGRGYMAWGYLNMLKATGDEEYKQKAILCLKWLENNKAPGFSDLSWGKHFNYASRGGRYGLYEPITVWTSIIGLVFMDAFEILQDEHYLEISESICNWILKVPRNQTGNGTCIEYTTTGNGDCTIHNHSMLAAAMLVKTAKYVKNNEYEKLAKSAMKYSCNSQLPDGSWYYGEASNHHWIDNFHTGYNLDALRCYIEYSGDTSFEKNLKNGFEFYYSKFFESTGIPKYYHNRIYPIDIQCAAQAIETLVKFSDYDTSSLDLGLKVAEWTIENMQDKSGYFYYRRYPFIKAKIPMIHWGQSTTFNALALLLSTLNS